MFVLSMGKKCLSLFFRCPMFPFGKLVPVIIFQTGKMTTGTYFPRICLRVLSDVLFHKKTSENK